MADFALDFGLLIAYFIPGVIAMIGLAFLIRDVAALMSPLRSGDASTGLFVIIAAFAIAIGMLLSVLRANTVDVTFSFGVPYANYTKYPHYQSLGRSDPEYDQLRDEGKLNAFREAKENEKRPYQFYGNTLLSILLLLICWCRSSAKRGAQSFRAMAMLIGAALLAILLLYPASRKSYYRYNRAIQTLNNTENAFEAH